MNNTNSKIKFIYFLVCGFLLSVFLKVLYLPVIKSLFEADLLWYIPSVLREIKSLSFSKLIVNLFSVRTSHLWIDAFALKTYTVFVLSFFGPFARSFISISILFYFGCSILTFHLARRFKLSVRASLFSALSFLTLFANFHSYMWPMAFQHLVVVFFILLVLNLYLKTDEIMNNGKGYKKYFAATLFFNLLASFCRASVLILPIIIFSHILFCAKNDIDRRKKFDLWTPLFIAYLFYPLYTFSVGDLRLFKLFLNINIPSFAKFLILFIGGLFCIFALRAALKSYKKISFLFQNKAVVFLILAATASILLVTGGPSRLLIPYNFFAPFIGTLGAFLHPLQNTLLIDSTRIYHCVPFQLDVFNIILGAAIIIIFSKKFVLKERALLLLVIWYVIDIGYLYLRNPLVSRYFIYLSPVFSIIFCAVFDYLLVLSIDALKIKNTKKEIALCLVFVFLCIPNILAIRLALFRGKMANELLTYDYARTANLIHEDIGKDAGIDQAKKKGVLINNVNPMVFPKTDYFSVSDNFNDNIRFVFMQVFNDASLDVIINMSELTNNNDHEIYLLSDDGYLLYDKNGDRVGSFSLSFEEGLKQLGLNRFEDAREAFKKAKKARPFLFDYILSGLNLEDVSWITNDNDVRSWVNKIISSYVVRNNESYYDRLKYISTIINKEIDEYIQCIFYLSFLEYACGNIEESKKQFSEIRFLECDFKNLYSWLEELHQVKSDNRMKAFLDTIGCASLYVRYDDYADRYKFEKFLLRLTFGNK